MFFGKKKPFSCGETCFHFKSRDGKRESFIWARKPTGDEVLNYAHMGLENEQSELKKLSADSITVETMHRLSREKKFLPFAEKIITKIEGYADENGKSSNTIEFLRKYFPHHLEVVAIEAYKVDDGYKKKD